jgi:hypothetical protein
MLVVRVSVDCYLWGTECWSVGTHFVTQKRL